jgi:hypothetical protein
LDEPDTGGTVGSSREAQHACMGLAIWRSARVPTGASSASLTVPEVHAALAVQVQSG